MQLINLVILALSLSLLKDWPSLVLARFGCFPNYAQPGPFHFYKHSLRTSKRIELIVKHKRGTNANVRRRIGRQKAL
jgi:hypothetical protein